MQCMSLKTVMYEFESINVHVQYYFVNILARLWESSKNNNIILVKSTQKNHPIEKVLLSTYNIGLADKTRILEQA